MSKYIPISAETSVTWIYLLVHATCQVPWQAFGATAKKSAILGRPCQDMTESLVLIPSSLSWKSTDTSKKKKIRKHICNREGAGIRIRYMSWRRQEMWRTSVSCRWRGIHTQTGTPLVQNRKCPPGEWADSSISSPYSSPKQRRNYSSQEWVTQTQ